MKGLDYLHFMANFYARTPEEEKEFVDRAVAITELGDRLKTKVGTYSKGMTRKLLLARALMTKPVLAILDEPTSGLDVLNALEVREIVRRYVKEGTSVLLSSHNMLEIEFLSDRVALIDKGRILDSGTPVEFKDKHQRQEPGRGLQEFPPMKRFTNLLKKEIKELVTKQLIISLAFTVLLFNFIGQVSKKEVQKAIGDPDHLGPRPGRLGRLPGPAQGPRIGPVQDPRPVGQDQGAGPRGGQGRRIEAPPRHPQGLRRLPDRAQAERDRDLFLHAELLPHRRPGPGRRPERHRRPQRGPVQ